MTDYLSPMGVRARGNNEDDDDEDGSGDIATGDTNPTFGPCAVPVDNVCDCDCDCCWWCVCGLCASMRCSSWSG